MRKITETTNRVSGNVAHCSCLAYGLLTLRLVLVSYVSSYLCFNATKALALNG